MRIIAGQWRGRPIVAPAGSTTRPTSDRARETLFSILASRLGGFTNLAVADLFAGSGALGLEALSRGARSCLFIDSDKAATTAITRNLAALNASALVRQGSALNALPPAEPLDLIFLDPPYEWTGLPALFTQLVAGKWLKPGGWISVETGRGADMGLAAQAAPALTPVTSRVVGKAELHIFRCD